jgi:hypothetical protein
MMPIRCYDNGGKTCDRYTILPARWVRGWSRRTAGGLLWEAIAASALPFHPQGFGMHIEATAGAHLGARVPFEALPPDVQAFARQTFEDMKT